MRFFTKVALMLATTLGSYGVFAQDAEVTTPEVTNKAMFKAGFNINGVSGKGAEEYTSMLGFHVGFGYEVGFNPNLALETGFYLDTRGFKLKKEYFRFLKDEVNLMHVGFTIPVLLKPQIQAGKDMSFYGLLGPFVNIGLAATFSEEVSAEVLGLGIGTIEELEFGDQEGQLKRFGYGLTFGGGFQYKKFLLGLSYDMGLNEIGKGMDTKFNAFKISFGARW